MNTFSAGAPGVPCGGLDILPPPVGTGLCSLLNPGQLLTSLGIKNLHRCPGSNERGLTSDQLTQGGTLDCDPNQIPLGP